MAPSTPPSDFSASDTPSGGRDGEPARGAHGGFSRPRADNPSDAAQEQDEWNRLSRTQADLLRPLAAQLFEKLDDALFDWSGTSSQQFFEGMRILRKNRDVLTQAWFGRLDEGWSGLRPQAPGAFRPRLVSAGGVPVGGHPAFADLALVDEKTLERNLAIENAIARGASLCRMELPPLLHRLTVLRHGVVAPEEEVPAAPAMLVRTFAKSLDEVPQLPVEVALVVFKLFDRVVVSAVGVVCQEINRLLVRAGVAPAWTWAPAAVRRPRTAAPVLPPGAASAHSAGTGEDAAWLETVPALDAQGAYGAASHAPYVAPAGRYAGIAGGVEPEFQDFPPGAVDPSRLTASVRALLEHRRLARYAASWAPAAEAAAARDGASQRLPGGVPPRNGAVRQTAPQELELQTLMEILASLPPPSLPTSWVGEPEEAWDPNQIKHELRRTLDSRIHGDAARPGDTRAEAQDVALGEHEDVIDMVAMMFSFIQQDPALPAAVQALLSRLQLPFLRLALVDPQMFADADHPARALMDRLAEVGKGCTADNPQLAERMLRMHSLVGRIVKNHDASRDFFAREWAQFRSWSDALMVRAAARERDQVTPLASGEPAAASAEAAAADAAPAGDTGAASAEQRSRLHEIRLSVTSRMRERLDGHVLPEGLRHALSLLWVNHQVRIREMHGERSYEASWLDRQLDAVVGLLTAKPGAQAQADLEQDWPGIERAWTAVLAEGSATAEARARWIATFRRWAEIRTGRAAPDPSFRWDWHEGWVGTRSPAADGAPGVLPSADAKSRSASQGEPAVEPEPQRASTFKIKPILSKPTPARWKVGDWIEFRGDGSDDVSAQADPKVARTGRGKVSWIGSFTGRTILVKPDGTLWREENRADLDDLLDRDLAFVVPRESLFDRSLKSMFHKLRENVASALSGKPDSEVSPSENPSRED